MKESGKVRENPTSRKTLLERLLQFEQASAALRVRQTKEQRKESLEKLHEATAQLREYLGLHLAPKEMAEWRELPDSNAEVAAFGYELQMEHADLYRELGDLLTEIDEYDKAFDREEALTRISLTCKALATRIARHAAGEQADLGRYTA